MDLHPVPQANVGWLEPLLARVGEDAKHVVTPVIDIINPDSFNYTASPLVRWLLLENGIS